MYHTYTLVSSDWMFLRSKKLFTMLIWTLIIDLNCTDWMRSDWKWQRSRRAHSKSEERIYGVLLLEALMAAVGNIIWLGDDQIHTFHYRVGPSRPTPIGFWWATRCRVEMLSNRSIFPSRDGPGCWFFHQDKGKSRVRVWMETCHLYVVQQHTIWRHCPDRINSIPSLFSSSNKLIGCPHVERDDWGLSTLPISYDQDTNRGFSPIEESCFNSNKIRKNW